ncbi:MAG: hypothetical protein H0U80_01365 [Solirubrobacterales bacterium]|nr:hypothetical protein [Solirubrobacterales bacterium]
MSPADLKALCQEAALTAMEREHHDAERVIHSDFEQAIARLRSSERANRGTRGDPV